MSLSVAHARAPKLQVVLSAEFDPFVELSLSSRIAIYALRLLEC